MKITIEFKTDNAAFDDNSYEIQRVMRLAFDKIRYELGLPGVLQEDRKRASSPTLMDSNGNSVGTVLVEK